MSIDKESGLSQAEQDALKDDDDLDGGTADDDGVTDDDSDDGEGGDGDDAGDDQDADDQDGEGGDDQGEDDDGDGRDDDQGDDAGDDQGDDDAAAARPSSDKTREAQDKAREDEANANLGEIDGKLGELEQKFEDGDLTAKEYREELKKLTAERETVKEVLVEVKVSRTLRQERAREQWEEAQDRFFNAPENKRFVENEILFEALNNQVIRLARDPKNAGKPGDWVLAEAKKAVEQAFGAAPKDKKVDEPDKDAGKKPGDKPARPQRPPKVPPDLGGMPAADTEQPQEGRFAHLEKLSGRALEEAVSRMSPEDQDAWARAS